MSPVSAYENSSFGNRTLPQTLDDLALATPERLYASVPKGHDLSDGFIDVSCKEMARCANFMASWIRVHLGSSRDYETMAYIGIPDLRSAAVFLGAVKCGYRVCSSDTLFYQFYHLMACRFCCLHQEISRR